MATAAITVDLDTTKHYRAIHGLPDVDTHSTLDAAYDCGVARLLELFAEFDIPATLFVIGEDVDAHPSHRALLTRAHAAGHELGNHTHTHPYNLRELGAARITEELELAERAIASVTGAAPVGFRTPGYNVDDALFALVEERGYLYDSSIFPCPAYYLAKAGVMSYLRLRGTPSGSAMVPARTQVAPTSAYKPSRASIAARGLRSQRMWEVPMCVVPGARLPVIGTSLAMMGWAGFKGIYPALELRYRSLLQLEFHAIDFMDASDPGVQALVEHQPDLRIPWHHKRELFSRIFERVARRYEFDTLANALNKMG